MKTLKQEIQHCIKLAQSLGGGRIGDVAGIWEQIFETLGWDAERFRRACIYTLSSLKAGQVLTPGDIRQGDEALRTAQALEAFDDVVKWYREEPEDWIFSERATRILRDVWGGTDVLAVQSMQDFMTIRKEFVRLWLTGRYDQYDPNRRPRNNQNKRWR